MKTVRSAFLSLIVLLVFVHTVQGKVCDDVLYLAYNGSWTSIEGELYPRREDIVSIPYYFGIICIDKVNKELTYYSRSENAFLNKEAQRAVDYLNCKTRQEITLLFKEEYTVKGEGQVSKKGATHFYAPMNTALFPYWAGEYVKSWAGRVFRRDVNAEPELDWVPTFTDSRPFTRHLIGEDPRPSLDWTDSKGRSGP